MRYASRKYWDQLAGDLRRIYTAPSVAAAWAAFEELEEKWGKPYPAIPKLWRAAWEEFTPFLAYDVEIRRVLFSTNAIESLNARYRRAVTVRGHFPTEQAALKCLYLVTPADWTPSESPRRVRRLRSLGRMESCQGVHRRGIRPSCVSGRYGWSPRSGPSTSRSGPR